MKILITNDDGIFAPGIEALVSAFSQAGHEIYVCAPDSQRSAASHSLSIGKNLTVREVPFPGTLHAYAIGGTPVDCAKLGLLVLCPEAEAVISGVNKGYNAGSDILYSGTVGAAMEGAICGRPALAVSQMHARMDYTQAAALAVRVFAHMQEHPLPPLSVMNLNYPECDQPRGVVSASTGQLHYDETYTLTEIGGEKTYCLSGVVASGRKQSDDYEKLCAGYATLNVLRGDMTDAAETSIIKFDL